MGTAFSPSYLWGEAVMEQWALLRSNGEQVSHLYPKKVPRRAANKTLPVWAKQNSKIGIPRWKTKGWEMCVRVCVRAFFFFPTTKFIYIYFVLVEQLCKTGPEKSIPWKKRHEKTQPMGRRKGITVIKLLSVADPVLMASHVPLHLPFLSTRKRG